MSVECVLGGQRNRARASHRPDDQPAVRAPDQFEPGVAGVDGLASARVLVATVWIEDAVIHMSAIVDRVLKPWLSSG